MRLQFVSINTVSYSIFLLQTHAGDDASLLIDENAALRATLNARLDKLDEAERKAFYAEHAALAELASEAGVSIPLLDGAPAAPAPKKAEKQKAAPAPVVAEAPPAPTAEAKVVMKDAGVAAVVEVDRDNTLVFKFGDAETPSLAIANAGKASSMAADGLPGSRAVRRGSTNKAAGPTGGDSEKEPVVFKFDTSKTAAPASVPAAAVVAAALAPVSAEEDAIVEVPAAAAAAAPRSRGRSTTRRASAPAKNTAASRSRSAPAKKAVSAPKKKAATASPAKKAAAARSVSRGAATKKASTAPKKAAAPAARRTTRSRA